MRAAAARGLAAFTRHAAARLGLLASDAAAAQPSTSGRIPAAAAWGRLTSSQASSGGGDREPPSPILAPQIRNFSIIAHIDHGKSTLADRLLAATGTVPAAAIAARGGQWLDGMALERERGITIKLNTARMRYVSPANGQTYVLNLIDTPGHVDFAYEVSRSLAACEGALLVVDAAQGVQAQTLAVVESALEADLAIIPVFNKIDLPGADTGRTARQVEDLIGLDCSDALHVSAKTGAGVEGLLEAILAAIPPPPDTRASPLRALVFDSAYDAYKGVIVYVRVVDGELKVGDSITLMASGKAFEVGEIGILTPGPSPVASLAAGEVGYLSAGIKAVADARVGDTITSAARPAPAPLPGYRDAPQPMVYAGLFPSDAASFPDLREALGRLQLNDAALAYEPEVSPAMGSGFRCGFLGLLHMEVVQERLEREYGLDLITTAPTVVYRVVTPGGVSTAVSNPAALPDDAGRGRGARLEEPYARLDIVTPSAYVGPLMELAQARRGEQVDLAFPGPETARLAYEMPLSEVVTDFFDELKSRSRGYASMEYHVSGYRPSDLVRLDVKINGEIAEPLACVVHRGSAYRVGRGLVERLKALIPRHQFRVPIQAAVGSRIIASEAIPAVRKDVTAKCYGGDVSRKKKLLAQQAKGKKRMKAIGKVEVPQAAFMAVLSIGGGGGGGGADD